MALKKISSLFIIFILFFIQCISKQATNYGIPKLEPDEVWISSIPVGLKVFLLPAKGYVDTDSLRTEKNFKGKTPVTIKIDSGHYLIGIEKVYPIVYNVSPLSGTWEMALGLDKDEYPWYPDRNDLKKEGNFAKIKWVSGIMFGKGDRAGQLIGFGLIKISSIEKKANEPYKLISLNYLVNTNLKSLNQFYPKGNNFLFDDTKLARALSAKGITQNNIKNILRLLHQGGKLAFKMNAEHTIVVEILGENEWDIYEFKDK